MCRQLPRGCGGQPLAFQGLNGLHRGDRVHVNSATYRRDWCGLDLAVRGPIFRPYRSYASPKSHDTEEMDLRIYLGLEALALSHPCRLVRGQSAGWAYDARTALRVEQSSNYCFNALVPHKYLGLKVTVSVGAPRLDKHPDPSKMRPPPTWSVIDGVLGKDAIRAPLFDMLEGADEVCAVILDTDSPDGSPCHPSASCFILSSQEAVSH